MSNRVVVLGDLRSRRPAIEYLAAGIRRAGCEWEVVDVGEQHGGAGGGEGTDCGGDPTPDRRHRLSGRIAAVTRRVTALRSAGELDGIVALGGAQTTQLASQVMGLLPFGLPKVLVSSMAGVPAYAGQYFGTKDLMIFHSVVDINGMNPLLSSILDRAACAVAGMVLGGGGPVCLEFGRGRRPRVALTGFEFSQTFSATAARVLEEAGVQVLPFHAQGTGDRAMEEFIELGQVDAVLDAVPAGVSEELLGGNRAAGPKRLETAGSMGIPQVVTPCGFDMLSCGPLERGAAPDPLWATRELSKRKLFIADTLRVEARTNTVELREVAEVVARKLNRAKAPVRFLIPRRGWSTLSEAGAPLCDFEADRAFVERLRERLAPSAELRELDLPLDSPGFAEAAVQEFLSLLGIGSAHRK